MLWAAALLTVTLLLNPQQVVQEFAETQAERIENDFTHSVDLADLIGPNKCGAVGERIGTGPNMERIERAWKESPSHAIIPTAQSWDYNYTAINKVGTQLYVVDIWCVYWKDTNEKSNGTAGVNAERQERFLQYRSVGWGNPCPIRLGPIGVRCWHVY